MLSVRNLRLEFRHGLDSIVPVDDVSFAVGRGEILGIAGESGAGKSLTLKSLVGLTPRGMTRRGELLLDLHGTGLATYDPGAVRGRGVSFVFQDPMSALNPTMRVGDLIAEAPRVHGRLSKRAARARALELMTDVGIPEPKRRARMWPHQLSGGLRQRVMIAAALSTNPKLLLCDEPTTALDVSVQAQILALLVELRQRVGVSIVFVSHDLAVLGELCDRLIIMYAGRVMESGPVSELFARPRHPYTHALIQSVPSLDATVGALPTIPGQPPDPTAFSNGCRFAPRCQFAQIDCNSAAHGMSDIGQGHATACIHPEALGASDS
jgi:oligopeptide/dipeptide ABC transporter ATP-binding protein